MLASLKMSNVALFLLGRLKGIDEANALERLVASGRLPKGVLDVHRGDVVGQEHQFIAVQLLAILVRQRGLGDQPHQIHDEIARAGEGVEDMYVLVRKRSLELGLKHVFHAGDHEVRKRLRGVHDAVRVGNLDAEALEERS